MELKVKFLLILSLLTGSTVNALDQVSYNKLGCYEDMKLEKDRDFANVKFLGKHNNAQNCINFCVLKGYKFAGLQLTACYCDSSFGSYGKAASEECDARCPGEPDDICGADLRNSVVEAAVDILPIDPKNNPELSVVATDEDGFNIECQMDPPNRLAVGMEFTLLWEVNGVDLPGSDQVIRNFSTPFSLRSSSVKLGDTVVCKFTARLGGAEKWIPLRRSEPLFIGLQVLDFGGNPLTEKLTIFESSDIQTISARLTVPIDTDVTFTLNLDDSSVEDWAHFSCGDDTIDQVKLGTCSVTFTPDNWADAQTIQLVAVDEGKQEEDGQDLMISFTGDGQFIDQGVDVKIHVRDSVIPGAQCSSVNDPHMLTFDGIAYEMHYEGEFILYRHTQLPFEVRTLYRKCTTWGQPMATCNCGVIARAGDDVIIIDKCGTYPRTEVITNNDDEVSAGFKLMKQHGGREYKILFPHGAEVTVTMGYTTDSSLIDVFIKPAASDKMKTEGLCGYYSGIKADDFKHSDGDVSQDVAEGSFPREFSMSWRVEPSDSLYSGRVPSDAVTYEPSTLCACNKDASCEEQLSTYRCGQASEVDDTASRMKRQTTDTDNDEEFVYDPTFDPEPAVWPAGDWTKDEAEAHCFKAFEDTEMLGCGVGFEQYYQSCIADIKMTEGPEFTKEAVLSFIKACQALDETRPEKDMTKICINNCNESGDCIDGECVCNEGSYGEDCSITGEVAPTVLEPICCDTSIGPCTQMTLYGAGFLSGHRISCLISPLLEDQSFGDSVEVAATFITFEEIVCDIGDIPALPYMLSVQVRNMADGALAEPVTHTVYNSRCMTCKPNPDLKANTCYIDNECYMPEDQSSDDANMICNPDVSMSAWTPKVDNLCKLAGCEHTCKVVDQQAVCGCQVGFELNADMKNCHAEDPCADACDQTCKVDEDTNTAVCGCQRGFELEADKKTCKAKTPCAIAECQQSCSVKDDKAVCGCQKGFQLAENMKDCTSVNLCSDANCAQSCEVVQGKAQCGCSPALRLAEDGRSCEADNECEKLACTHFCENGEDNKPVCTCPKGFKLGNDSKTCLSICAEANCAQVCTVNEDIQEAECSCNDGFKLDTDDMKSCQAVDLCADAGCDRCAIKNGAPTCYCLEGYKLADDRKTCEDLCDLADCDHMCSPETGEAVCSCRKKYVLNEDGKSCDNLCRLADCAHHCDVNEENQAICSCNDGYELAGDDKSCNLIDLCAGAECQHACRVEGGQASCYCFTGYELDKYDLKSCDELRICKEKGCSHGCSEEDGVVKCLCFKGFRLDTDEKTCVEHNPCADLECLYGCIIDAEDSTAKCGCPEHYELAEDGKNCYATNLCEEADCRGQCSIVHKNDTYVAECACDPGWTLGKDMKTCIANNLCEEKMCDHQCHVEVDVAVCDCNTGHVLAEDGVNCIAENLCKEMACEQLCEVIKEEAVCDCQLGFKLDDNKKNCTAVCDLAFCEMGCTENNGIAVCVCPDNYVIDIEDSTKCNDINECETDKGGCSHTCQNTQGSYHCECRAGFQLLDDKVTCEDKCVNYGCSQLCEKDSDGNAFCTCNPGYGLDEFDNKECKDVDECLTAQGGCSQTCVNLEGSYRCECNEAGYVLAVDQHSCDSPCAGAGCTGTCTFDVDTQAAVCGCDKGFSLAGNGLECIDDDECEGEAKGICSHTCENLPGYYRCTCPDGYVLDEDLITCIDINECLVNNGGCSPEETCLNVDGTRVCECISGTKHNYDHSMCVDEKCIVDDPLIDCKCPRGYKLANDARTCIDIDECATDNGGCTQDCVNAEGTYSCVCRVECKPAYVLREDDQCDHKCWGHGCSHKCDYDAAKDSPVCSCPPGYALLDDGKTCQDKCEIDNGGCEWGCALTVAGDVQCYCPDNSELLPPDERNCRDPCDKGNGGCDQVCESTDFNVTCSCNPGWDAVVNENGTICVANRKELCRMDGKKYDTKLLKCIDTCNDGDCEQHCHVSAEGVRYCSCDQGYKLANDLTSCDDVDECATDVDSCQDVCTNTDGGYNCSCSNGDLNTDAHTCTTIDVCETLNGGCEDECVHTAHKTYECKCNKPGFIVDDYDHHKCTSLCDIMNGGCINARCELTEEGSTECLCDDGYTMLENNKECADNCAPGYNMDMGTGECTSKCEDDNGGCNDECTLTDAGVQCLCPNGGELKLDGQTCVECDEGYELVGDDCEDIDECDDGIDGCSYECVNNAGGYECKCPEGESELSTDGKTCTVIDVCALNNGNCTQSCIHEAHRRFRCDCYDGYELDTDHADCVSKCDIDGGGCSDSCELVNGVVTCGCKDGFVLDDGKKNCTDICETGVCAEDQTCENSYDSTPEPYTCKCLPGFVMVGGQCLDGCTQNNNQGCDDKCINNNDNTYSCGCGETEKLNEDGKSCDDIDECAESNGECSHTCINKSPGHECSCPPGTGDLGIHGKNCTIVDLCALEKHTCQHTCVHEGHKQYRCECDPGYELAEDDHTCINLCHVGNGGCDALAECFLATTGVVCECPEGYRLQADGETCENINECINEDLSLRCTHECQDTIGSYECICPEGLQLSIDTFTCTDVNECDKEIHQCSDTCINSQGSYTCSCPPNYQLKEDKKNCIANCEVNKWGCEHVCAVVDNQTVCLCNEGWELIPGTKKCRDVKECELNTHGCAELCIEEEGGFKCACKDGFELADDGKTCVDFKECLTDDKGGCSDICVEEIGSYKCDCSPGYVLSLDQRICKDDKECDTPGKGGCAHICVEEIGSYHCDCRDGYTLIQDLESCEDIPECDTNNGGCQHTCFEKPGSYECKCNPGYALAADKHTCENIDECSDNNGLCTHYCTDSEGSFTCSCPEGYILSMDGKTCKDVNECETQKGGCSGPGICINMVGSHRCECDVGYHLDYDERTCIDKDECLLSEDECSQICHNSDGSYSCTCEDGYTLAQDGKTCEDINECAPNGASMCTQRCENLDGGYNCSCLMGYELQDDEFTCKEIDRCEVENGGCGQHCESTLEKAVCSCDEGYTVNVDGMTCDDIDECDNGHNGGCRQSCHNLPGTYRCECEDNELCRPGFLLDELTDQCIDVDECEVDNGGCGELSCENTKGAFECLCEAGGKPDAYGQCPPY